MPNDKGLSNQIAPPMIDKGKGPLDPISDHSPEPPITENDGQGSFYF